MCKINVSTIKQLVVCAAFNIVCDKLGSLLVIFFRGGLSLFYSLLLWNYILWYQLTSNLDNVPRQRYSTINGIQAHYVLD